MKRILIGLLLFLLALLLAGAIYQVIGERADLRRFPPPGQLVDVGGYRMHLHCQGGGEPTLILESLSGGMSSYWAWVQTELAQDYRVCAYDRAGRGWSESRPTTPLDYAEQTVKELRILLQNAGIPGPYFLVGHSIGGIYTRLFVETNPGQVAGLVLLDSAHPFQFERALAMVAEYKSFKSQSAVFPWLARIGLFRLYFSLGGELDFQDLPPQQHDEVAALWSSPRYFLSQRAENDAVPEIYARGQNLGDLGDMPLVVITAAESSPEWLAMQAELASLSSDSLHVTIPGSTHVSLVFDQQHAAAVSGYIGQLVEAVQEGRPVSLGE
jgi:pimeloyl-ACP methyl ester carboxylesterase